ncbi:MAG TPA: PA domain-containing protein [Thermoanaerobaculia bacterium]|jgi:hypothetical protein
MKKRALLLLASLLLVPTLAFANAQIIIINGDAPGVGFNDPTPAVPVGGNNGTTMGQQRMNVFLYVASIWAAALDSPVPITVRGNFGPLSCNATSATLAQAGARSVYGNHPNARETNTWYHIALANKQAGEDLAPVGGPVNPDDLGVSFNSNIGTPGCLQNSAGWYYGLDTNTPAGKTNVVATLLHEFGHGLGFSNFVNRITGANFGEPTITWPDIYQKRMFDNTMQMYWDQMSASQRLTSRLNNGNLAWAGATAKAEAPSVLSQVGRFRIDSPSSVAGNYGMGFAEFGPQQTVYPGLSGQLVQAIDDINAAGPSNADGCTAITNDVNGKIAFVNRGTCGFAIKVKNAELAGAIGVVVGDNAAGPVVDMGSSGDGAFDKSISIPSGRVTLATANTIRAGLAAGTVMVNLGVDPVSPLRGTDSQGRVLLYAPTTFISGSSLSHWDTSATRNLLMEPSSTMNLRHSVKSPDDLTLAQMRDIGWYPDADVDLVEDGDDNCPNAANADQANYDGDAQGDACDSDDDNDGVADVNDANPYSNMQPTVVINGCNSNAPNVVFPNGQTLMDRIAAITASNHGQFASAVSAVTNEAKALGLLTGAEKGAIQNCAAAK